MNKAGGVYFANRELQNAYSCFRLAVETLAAGVAELRRELDDRNHALHGASLISRLPTALGTGTVATENKTYFVFQDAILFDDDHEISTASLTLFCSVIEFNLALTCHMQYQQEGDARLLSRALDLYESCVRHISNAFGLEDTCVILVAALNNASLLFYQELGDVQHVQRCLQALTKAVTYCQNNPGILTDVEIQELMLNLMALRDLMCSAAA